MAVCGIVGEVRGVVVGVARGLVPDASAGVGVRFIGLAS